MNVVAKYFDELTSQAGASWNRFWFTPSNPGLVSLLRLLTGLMAVWYLAGYTSDLLVWFGADGLLPIDMAKFLTQNDAGDWNRRLSYWFVIDEPRALYVVHGLGLLVAALFAAGVATRVTSVLTFVVVISYIHRGPFLTGPLEPVLSAFLLYLCLAPCGRQLSFDAWWKHRRQHADAAAAWSQQPSVAANIATRLMQIHLAGFYLMMGLTKLAGETWWSGEAMWWLIAHSESRLVDLTFLHDNDYTINVWTYSVVMLEVLFGVLIWNRLARPLLLVAAVIHWTLLAPVTGLVSYSAMMLVANLCFITPTSVRVWLGATSSAPTSRVPDGAR